MVCVAGCSRRPPHGVPRRGTLTLGNRTYLHSRYRGRTMCEKCLKIIFKIFSSISRAQRDPCSDKTSGNDHNPLIIRGAGRRGERVKKRGRRCCHRLPRLVWGLAPGGAWRRVGLGEGRASIVDVGEAAVGVEVELESVGYLDLIAGAVLAVDFHYRHALIGGFDIGGDSGRDERGGY